MERTVECVWVDEMMRLTAATCLDVIRINAIKMSTHLRQISGVYPEICDGFLQYIQIFLTSLLQYTQNPNANFSGNCLLHPEALLIKFLLVYTHNLISGYSPDSRVQAWIQRGERGNSPWYPDDDLEKIRPDLKKSLYVSNNFYLSRFCLQITIQTVLIQPGVARGLQAGVRLH